jgi:uncharacterized membrane protein YidH (DUF202 family)
VLISRGTSTLLSVSSSSNGHDGPVGLLIFGIVLVAIGLFHSIKPDLGWRMSRWQYRNRRALEPSAAALVVTRVIGVIAVVVGVVLIIVAAT